MYPGDLVCILVTPLSACQEGRVCAGGFRQGIAPYPGMPAAPRPVGSRLAAPVAITHGEAPA